MGKHNTKILTTLLCLLLITISSALSFAQSDQIAEIRGTVVDSTGQTLQGATIRITNYWGGPLSPQFPLPVISGAEGAYLFKINLPATGEITLNSIWAEKEGFVTSKIEGPRVLDPNKAVVVDFKLEAGEVLEGKIEPIKTSSGEAQRRWVTVSKDGYSESVHADIEGKFMLYVPKGTYSIEVSEGRTKNYKPIEVASGTRDVLIPAIIIPKFEELSAELQKQTLEAAFDKLWSRFDANYSYFAYKPDIDWGALKDKYRDKAINAQTKREFVEHLQAMLTELKDMHIWMELDEEQFATYSAPWQRNWNPHAMMKSLEAPQQIGKFSIVGRSIPDGFGVVILNSQGAATSKLVEETVAAIQNLHDAPAFIVDLRGGGTGGSEPLAGKLAAAFCSGPTVYAKSKIRSGPAHTDFSPVRQRTLQPGERPFVKPTVCLIGNKVMSSGEGLALMLKSLPQVTTIGMRTRGASGNPKPLDFPEIGLIVTYSRWVDLDLDEQPFEGIGIPPAIEINLPVEAYRDQDPTFDAAIEYLRKQIASPKIETGDK